LQHLGLVVFTLQHHLGLALSLYLAASGLGFESLPCSIWAWLSVFTLQHHQGLALRLYLAASSAAWLCIFTLQHLGLALSLYLAASSGLGFEQHLGLALSLYLASSGLFGFKSLPCSICAWISVFTLHHLGLDLSLYLAASWLGFESLPFSTWAWILSLYLAASGLGFERAEKGTPLWHEVIVSRLVQQISTLVTRPAREKL
jgi:hypothetical protein